MEILRTALQDCSGMWRKLVSKEKGLTYRWVVGFGSGQIKDPSARRLKSVARMLGYNLTLTRNADAR